MYIVFSPVLTIEHIPVLTVEYNIDACITEYNPVLTIQYNTACITEYNPVLTIQYCIMHHCAIQSCTHNTIQAFAAILDYKLYSAYKSRVDS